MSAKGRIKRLEATAKDIPGPALSSVPIPFAGNYRITLDDFVTVATNEQIIFRDLFLAEPDDSEQRKAEIEGRLSTLSSEKRDGLVDFAGAPLSVYFEGLLKLVLRQPHRIDFDLHEVGLEHMIPLVEETPNIDYPFSAPHKAADTTSSALATAEVSDAFTDLARLMVSEFASLENRFAPESDDDEI